MPAGKGEPRHVSCEDDTSESDLHQEFFSTHLPSRPVSTMGGAEREANSGHRKPSKIVLCFDGTGNKFHGDDSDSNILVRNASSISFFLSFFFKKKKKKKEKEKKFFASMLTIFNRKFTECLIGRPATSVSPPSLFLLMDIQCERSCR